MPLPSKRQRNPSVEEGHGRYGVFIYNHSQLAVIDNPETKKFKQFCSGKVPFFAHPSLYRALKLTYLWDISGLSLDGSIKTDEPGVNGRGRWCPFLDYVQP